MLSHIDKKGNAKIVDISSKEISSRIAKASGKIKISEDALKQINLNSLKKGDIYTVSKIAAIFAAKNTSNIIPLCHPVKIEDITITFNTNIEEKFIEAEAQVKSSDKTGVEMEALTAVSIALLTIHDMVKAGDKAMVIFDIKRISKTGGKSDYHSNDSI